MSSLFSFQMVHAGNSQSTDGSIGRSFPNHRSDRREARKYVLALWKRMNLSLVLQTESDGRPKMMDWESAKKACLDLNTDSEQRRQVESQLAEIKTNAGLKDSVSSSGEERREKFWNLVERFEREGSNLLPKGCFLPPLEISILYEPLRMGLRSDFRFLPNGEVESYWTSSTWKSLSFTSLKWSGGLYTRVLQHMVRCACTRNSKSRHSTRWREKDKASNLKRAVLSEKPENDSVE